MRLLPFLSEDIRVGIDITIDSIRIVAIDGSGAPACVPGGDTAPVDVLSVWEFEFDLFDAFDRENPSGWIDAICQTLRQELPPNARSHATSTIVSLPSSWLHFGTNASQTDASACASRLFAGPPFFSSAHTKCWPLVPSRSAAISHSKTAANSDTPDHRVFASVSEDTVLRIAACLQSRGYRVDGIIPDGVAVGINGFGETERSTPCVVMLHRDGGTITIFDHGVPALVRTLPPIENPAENKQDVPSRSPHPASVRNWGEIIGLEIQSTFEYYSRCSEDWKFADRVTADSPIVFAGSIFPVLEQAGFDCIDLLGQWSNDIERPVAMWSSSRLIQPVFEQTIDDDEANPEQASALSLAMFTKVSGQDDFNLLPPAFNLGNRYRNVRFRWAGVLAITTVLAIMFGINSYLHQRQIMTAEQDRIAIIEPIRSHLKHLQMVTQIHRDKLELIDHIASDEPTDDGLQAIGAIAHATQSSGVELHTAELDFILGTWKLSGKTETEESLVRVSDRLKKTGWVKNKRRRQGADAVIVSALSGPSKSPDYQESDRTWILHEDGTFHWNPSLGTCIAPKSVTSETLANQHQISEPMNVTVVTPAELQR